MSNLLASGSEDEVAADPHFEMGPDHFGQGSHSEGGTGQRPSGSQHDGQPANLGDVYNDRSNPNGDSFVLLIVFRVCLMAVFRSVLCGAKFLGIGLKESILDLLKPSGARKNFVELSVLVAKEWRLVYP